MGRNQGGRTQGFCTVGRNQGFCSGGWNQVGRTQGFCTVGRNQRFCSGGRTQGGPKPKRAIPLLSQIFIGPFEYQRAKGQAGCAPWICILALFLTHIGVLTIGVFWEFEKLAFNVWRAIRKFWRIALMTSYIFRKRILSRVPPNFVGIYKRGPTV